jgi:hypothetical protein
MDVPYLRRSISPLALLSLFAMHAATEGEHPTPRLFTKLQQTRQLSPEAAGGFPVQSRCIVTHYAPAVVNLCVQDATAGVYVDIEKPLELQRNLEIETSGITVQASPHP